MLFRSYPRENFYMDVDALLEVKYGNNNNHNTFADAVINDLYKTDNDGVGYYEVVFSSGDNYDTSSYFNTWCPIEDTFIKVVCLIQDNFINNITNIDILSDSGSLGYMEFVDGKRRILVDRTALKGTPQVDENGNISQQLYFDRNDRTYVAMNGMKDQPVKDISFDLRYQEHIDSINAELNWYSASLDFGESFYKFDGNGQATATEILSQDDDAFRTKQTFETVIKDVLIDLVKSVCYLEGIELSENEIQVEFDYSRFENQEKTQARLEREVSKGITSKVEYRMKV